MIVGLRKMELASERCQCMGLLCFQSAAHSKRNKPTNARCEALKCCSRRVLACPFPAADSQPATPKPLPEAFGRADSALGRPTSLRSDSAKSYSSADGAEDKLGSAAGAAHALFSQQLCDAFGRSVTIKSLPAQELDAPAAARAGSPAPRPGRAGSPNPMAYGRSVSSLGHPPTAVPEVLPVPTDPEGEGQGLLGCVLL